MLKGCDISEHQGKIDFFELKKVVDFVIIRSSYGKGYFDKWFAYNKDQARLNGIPIGFYHYAYPQYNTPEAEAEWFYNACGYDLREGELLALDFEEDYPDPALWCERFLNHLSSMLGGYKPLLYINLALANSQNTNWKPVITGNYGLWLAYWNYDPNKNDDFNTPWSVVAIRQWSSDESFSGISGRVDANVFYGDLTALAAYGYKKPVVNQPVTPTPVNPEPVNPPLQPEPEKPQEPETPKTEEPKIEEQPENPVVEPELPKIEPKPEEPKPVDAPESAININIDTYSGLIKFVLIWLLLPIFILIKFVASRFKK